MKRLCALLLALTAACGSSGEADPAPPASLEVDPARPLALKTVPSAPVQGFAGPGDRPFSVALRTPDIGQYPCATCHEQPLPAPAPAETSRRWAHADVRLEHAALLACRSCHEYAQMQSLRLQSGERIDLDHSYQLCAQCHSGQARDWAGGAHGKRLGGWRGERVVAGCTTCHDPHAPTIPPRMPVLYPRVPRSSR